MGNMPDPRVEQHPTGTTIYVIGALSVRHVLRTIDMMERLPAACASLRIDVLGVDRFEVRAVDMLHSALRQWELRRAGRAALTGRDAHLAALP